MAHADLPRYCPAEAQDQQWWGESAESYAGPDSCEPTGHLTDDWMPAAEYAQPWTGRDCLLAAARESRDAWLETVYRCACDWAELDCVPVAIEDEDDTTVRTMDMSMAELINAA